MRRGKQRASGGNRARRSNRLLLACRMLALMATVAGGAAAAPPVPGEGGARPPAPVPAPAPPTGQPPLQPLPSPVVPRADSTGVLGVETLYRFYSQLAESARAGRVARPARPPRGWKRYADPSVPRVIVNHPEGWQVTSVARASTGFSVDFADVRITSPDRLHLIVATRRVLFEAEFAAARADELVAAYAARLGPGTPIKREELYIDSPRTMTAADFAFRAARAGAYVVVAAVTVASATYGGQPVPPYLEGTTVIVGPTAYFSSMAPQVYVPILNSMTSW